MLIHREFTYRYYARLIIEADKIIIENANKPFIHGNINPDTNIPHPKNPILANFFKEIGLADELGSGVRKIFSYYNIWFAREFIYIFPVADTCIPQGFTQTYFNAGIFALNMLHIFMTLFLS